MARLTDIEQQLLEQITDARWGASLSGLREAAEGIWASDAPRIIQDYTDHSIAHSERVAGFAARLLGANEGRTLSAQEIYLLLAGIYLHDIGMQCEVCRFPEVRERAEEFGAKFALEFDVESSSRYSLEEQKAVRDNHHYLSAAWIDYAYRTGESSLGPAAKTIPEELVADLMDVCKYHAKLPITECPLFCRFAPTQRKQLVAGLLRFADELDVDGNRASIETVTNFRLLPRSSVYWWLHNRTIVAFTARNVILLTIRLHPEDAKEYGPFVHAGFISEFQQKNGPVLGILRQNSLPVAIDADSGVLRDQYTQRVPVEIVQALQAMEKEATIKLAELLVRSF